MNREVSKLKAKYPSGWEVIPFSEAIKDVTAGNPKIKKSKYKESGKLPVIDQGQELIGGFIDDQSKACKEQLPCILFGDHTKIFKFINQPFALGADGVKVLSPIGDFDKRFLFHYLKTLDLPENAGYSRHYKFLKERTVIKPPLAEQKRISAILDKAEAIRQKRQKAIKLADDFLRSVFLDMFGDPVTNPKGWEVKPLERLVMFKTGKLDSNAAVKRGRYPFFTCSKENFQIDTYAFDCEALLLSGNNAAGEYSVKYFNGKFNAYQRTYIITIIRNNISYPYLHQVLEIKLRDLKRMSKGTNTKYLTLGLLNDIQIQIPNKESIINFDKLSEKIKGYKDKNVFFSQIADINFKSIIQRAFRGEL